MKKKLGILGLACGFLAIFVAIFQEDLRQVIYPKPSLKEKVMTTTAKMLDTITSKDTDDSPTLKKRDEVTMTYYGLGFLALVFGAIAFIRKENGRLAMSSIATGLVAIAWAYVIYAVAVAIFLMILSAMVS